jgi:uroporphyrinogen decarboxylase
MSKLELLKKTIRGETVDRIPATAWFHFGGQFMSPEQQASYYLNVLVPQDWDLLKVMFDYRPHTPSGFSFRRKSDLRLLLEAVDWEEPFRKQRECTKLLISSGCNNTPIVESVYSPWFYMLRWAGRDFEANLFSDQATVTKAVEKIASLTCDHLSELARLGVHGYFYATIAASKAHSRNTYGFQAEIDRQILASNNRIYRYLHLHGNEIDISRIGDYEFDVLNYSDRHPSNPSLSEIRKSTQKCLMGGVCEQTITYTNPQELEMQIVREAMSVGSSGLILSPGCSVSPSVGASHCSAIRNASFHISRFAR